MKRRTLGDTGLEVSPLGLGTVKIGRNRGIKYSRAFELPEDEAVVDILNTAKECGINLLDTAPAYGSSEIRLGELLPKAAANDWLLCTKVGEIFDPGSGESLYDFSPGFIRRSVEQSLLNLKREVLDMVLLHSDGNDEYIIRELGALETLNQLKREGLIRACGLSGKTVAGGLLALEQSDIVMVTHNLQYQNEVAVIETAEKQNKGVLIKKAFASGHISNAESHDPMQQSFDAIFSLKGVSSVVCGTINPAHIRENTHKATLSLNRY